VSLNPAHNAQTGTHTRKIRPKRPQPKDTDENTSARRQSEL
jgi:hypothetical protein